MNVALGTENSLIDDFVSISSIDLGINHITWNPWPFFLLSECYIFKVLHQMTLFHQLLFQSVASVLWWPNLCVSVIIVKIETKGNCLINWKVRLCQVIMSLNNLRYTWIMTSFSMEGCIRRRKLLSCFIFLYLGRPRYKERDWKSKNGGKKDY